jgi:membrane associated rhomboid family serine protease
LFPLKDNIPTREFPLVTVVLIAMNVIAYLFLQPKSGIDFGGGSLDQAPLYHYGAIPYELTHPGQHCDLALNGCGKGVSDGGIPTVASLFTAMFTHSGLLHLGGNMLFLWIFGNNVEDAMGKLKFIAFYLLGGLAAIGGQVLIDPNSVVPTLGASGAIAAVLGGYILLYPRAKVLSLVFIILFVGVFEIPAVLFLGVWFAEQILFGTAGLTNPTGGGGGVAYFAHIGGFAFGLLFIRLFATRRNEAADAPRFPVY